MKNKGADAGRPNLSRETKFLGVNVDSRGINNFSYLCTRKDTPPNFNKGYHEYSCLIYVIHYPPAVACAQLEGERTKYHGASRENLLISHGSFSLHILHSRFVLAASANVLSASNIQAVLFKPIMP